MMIVLNDRDRHAISYADYLEQVMCYQLTGLNDVGNTTDLYGFLPLHLNKMHCKFMNLLC